MNSTATNINNIRDLELMLAPLARLPGVEGVGAEIQRYLGEQPEPLELQIHLELDPRDPLNDFAHQLIVLVHQVAITDGVVLSPGPLRFARKLVLHAEVVAAAWDEAGRD